MSRRSADLGLSNEAVAIEWAISDDRNGSLGKLTLALDLSEKEVMTRLDKIEQDIAGLSNDELARFRVWFELFEADRFDQTIEDGIRAGKLNAMADAALADMRAGKTRPL